MPIITIAEQKHPVPEGTRLALAIEAMGIHIGHRCGGKAKCTTCRVSFVTGEPETMTQAEFSQLKEKDLLGQARLSCQIEVHQDMELNVLMTHEDNPNWADTGPALDPTIMPEAVFLPLSELS
ncbi:MAG: 2Fe-2S iron-sulfur cluster-binding protein [Deinococcales bacterium]